MFYVDYVYTFVFKKVWDQFNESISSDIILKMTVKIFNTSAGFKEAKLMNKSVNIVYIKHYHYSANFY
jgi:hypothetical protein